MLAGFFYGEMALFLLVKSMEKVKIPPMDTFIVCSEILSSEPLIPCMDDKALDVVATIELEGACELLGRAFTMVYRAVLKKHLKREVTFGDEEKVTIMQSPGYFGMILIVYDNIPIAVVNGIGSSSPNVRFL